CSDQLVLATFLNSCDVSGYRRNAEISAGRSTTRSSALQSWLCRGPPENGYAVGRLIFRLHDRNQIDTNVSVGILIFVGIISDRIDSRRDLHASPTIRQ